MENSLQLFCLNYETFTTYTLLPSIFVRKFKFFSYKCFQTLYLTFKHKGEKLFHFKQTLTDLEKLIQHTAYSPANYFLNEKPILSPPTHISQSLVARNRQQIKYRGHSFYLLRKGDNFQAKSFKCISKQLIDNNLKCKSEFQCKYILSFTHVYFKRVLRQLLKYQKQRKIKIKQ